MVGYSGAGNFGRAAAASFAHVDQVISIFCSSLKIDKADVHELIQSTKLYERPKLSDDSNDYIEDCGREHHPPQNGLKEHNKLVEICFFFVVLAFSRI